MRDFVRDQVIERAIGGQNNRARSLGAKAGVLKERWCAKTVSARPAALAVGRIYIACGRKNPHAHADSQGGDREGGERAHLSTAVP